MTEPTLIRKVDPRLDTLVNVEGIDQHLASRLLWGDLSGADAERERITTALKTTMWDVMRRHDGIRAKDCVCEACRLRTAVLDTLATTAPTEETK